MEAILYIGISQTLFAGILIVLKRPRVIANHILAAWLFIICFEMIIVLINETLIELYPIKILPYTYGPLLFLYAKWMTSEKPHFDLRYLWHFAPFFIFLIVSLIFIDERVMHGTDDQITSCQYISSDAISHSMSRPNLLCAAASSW